MSNVWTWPVGNFSPVPIPPSKGSFAFQRRFHRHEGVDLYTPFHSSVYAVEDGVIVGLEILTGPQANPPSPWWYETGGLLVEGISGVVLYGELNYSHMMKFNSERLTVKAGELLGYTERVVREDNGRPTCMLHLELYPPGTRKSQEFSIQLDPTEKLLEAQKHLFKQTFVTRE